MSRLKLIAETRVYISHKNMKSMGCLRVFGKFLRQEPITIGSCSRKIFRKTHFTGNGEWIESKTATITSDYVLHEHLSTVISSLAEKTNAPLKKGTMLLFSLTLKDTKIFPNLLFWSDSWVTAPVFHNRFFIINLYLMTAVIHSNREWPSLYKFNWRCLFTFKAC